METFPPKILSPCFSLKTLSATKIRSWAAVTLTFESPLGPLVHLRELSGDPTASLSPKNATVQALSLRERCLSFSEMDPRPGHVCQMPPKGPLACPRPLWGSFILDNPPWSSHLNLSYPGDAPLPAQPFGGCSETQVVAAVQSRSRV